MNKNSGEFSIRFMRYLLVACSLFIFSSSAFAQNDELTVRLEGSGTIVSGEVPPVVDCADLYNANNNVTECYGIGPFPYTYTNGTPVTLTATPLTGVDGGPPGFYFKEWKGGTAAAIGCNGSSNPVCSFLMGSLDSAITADFEQGNTLFVNAGDPFNDAGSFNVTSSPVGIDCDDARTQDSSQSDEGKDCAETYAPGTGVTLTATIGVGTNWVGWQGSCASTSGSGNTQYCTVQMSSTLGINTTITPVTELEQKRLTVTRLGTGDGGVTSDPVGINCGPDTVNTDCEYIYNYDDRVELTATPAAGSALVAWGGNIEIEAACNTTPIQNPCRIRITSDLTVTATFDIANMLTVGIDGNGFGNVISESDEPGDENPPNLINCSTGAPIDFCRHNYDANRVVTLYAAPDPASVFTGWSEATCPDTIFTCTVTMSSSQTVIATFKQKSVLDVGISMNTDMGIVTSDPLSRREGSGGALDCTTNSNMCSGDYVKNEVVELTAVAEPGYIFSGWTGSICGGSLNPTCNVQMLTNIGPAEVTADFVPAMTLDITVTGAGKVNIDPPNVDCDDECQEDYLPYDPLDPAMNPIEVTLTAIPDPGVSFTGWAGTGLPVSCSGGSTSCVVEMDQSRAIEAMFNVENTLTVEKKGIGNGTVTSVPTGINCGAVCSAEFTEGSTVKLTATSGPDSVFTGWNYPACSNTGTTCNVIMDANLPNPVTATFKKLGLCGNDVVVDFGAGVGIYACMNNGCSPNGTGWHFIHDLSPTYMIIGDIDGTGQDDLIVDFGAGIGIYALMNYDPLKSKVWKQLTPGTANSVIAAGDMDGNNRDEVLADFGADGIWIYWNDSEWTKLHSLSPNDMVVGQFFGNTKTEEAIIDFGVDGIWVRVDNSYWFPLFNTSEPESMMIGSVVDNTAPNDVIMDFGASGGGIFAWSNNYWWRQVHGYSPESMVIGDLDIAPFEDPLMVDSKELIIDFGEPYGIWGWRRVYNVDRNDADPANHTISPTTNWSWNPLHPVSANVMAAGNMNCDDFDDVVIDFGSANGGIYLVNGQESFWTKTNSQRTWKQLHPATGKIIVTGNLDGKETPQTRPDLSADKGVGGPPPGLLSGGKQPFPKSQAAEVPIIE